MTSIDLWNSVVERWRRSSPQIPDGVNGGALTAFERKYTVALPEDVRQYFLAADGSGGEVDDWCYRFWPLTEVKRVEEELSSYLGRVYKDCFAEPDCFVFADHLVNSWLYAVKLTDSPNQPAPVFRVMVENSPGEKMASSFREFMERYVANPMNIL